MGRGFYTVAEAALILKKDERTIRDYVKKGYLRGERAGRSFSVNEEDVKSMAASGEVPEFNKTSFMALMARVRSLEEKMSVVQRAMEIRDDPIRPSPEECAGLVSQATKASDYTSWDRKEIQMWSHLFDRMDEVALDAIAKEALSARPWESFYSLCIKMMDYVSTMSKEDWDPEWALLHKQLDEGRKKLRGTILMWIEMTHGYAARSLISALSTDKEDLVRRLAAKKN